jgi:inhibitor of KinA sporulation pathway (predicted exonuclease)
MNTIAFDLEWNIAGKANHVDPKIQEAIPFEIIEIGAVKLDSQYRQISRFSVQIRPKLYPVLSGHVAAVTRRMQQSLRYGLSFPDAARDFLAWCGTDYIFCTWSESDADVLKMNLKYYQIADHLEASCLDVQQVFDILVEQADVQRSIEYAADFLQIPKDRPFHQAVNDAAYTGQILRGIAEIMAREKPDLDWIGKLSYDPNLTRSYQLVLTGQDGTAPLLQELSGRRFACPACGADLEIQSGWIQQGLKAVAVFRCPDHGRVIGKCRFRNGNGNGSKWTAYTAIRLERSLEA